MNPFATIAVLFSAGIAYWTLNGAYPYPSISKFPEIWQGHTAVHLLDQGFPVRPAYMVWQDRRLLFFDLMTNRSIGDLHAYTGSYTYRRAYLKVRLTPPIYGRRSLHEYFSNPHFAHWGPLNPTIQAIMDRRKQFWWPVAIRQHQELLDWTYGPFVHTLYDTRLNKTINYTRMI